MVKINVLLYVIRMCACNKYGDYGVREILPICVYCYDVQVVITVWPRKGTLIPAGVLT